MIFKSNNAVETIAFGRKLASQLKGNETLGFFGDLAAGKTTLIKGIGEGLNISSEAITSPTFVYLAIHKGIKPLFHFDLWRLKGVDEFLSMGFDEFLFADGIKCIEWSERIESLLPPEVIKVRCYHLQENERRFEVENL